LFELRVLQKEVFFNMGRFALVALALVLSRGIASADTLNFDMLGNQWFYAYISTDDTVLGTFFTDESGCCGSSGSISLNPGQTYYLEIESLTYADAPAAGFTGTFSLSGSGLQFANGTQSLDTSSTNLSFWGAAYGGTIPTTGEPQQQTWVTPNENAVEEAGAPWAGSTIWAGDSQSSPAGLAWSDQCTYCYVDFSTEISGTTPEPSTDLLIAPVVLSFYGFRRYRVRRG
jgi:hypothetical protein